MAENIELNKEVFNKRTYQKTIDTSFNELGVQTVQEQLDSQLTIQEFFNAYDELFYQINELGPTNSHEFLVKTSGEYISFDQRDELIEALQLEIATVRKELLQSQQELANALLPEPQPVEELPEIEEIEVPEIDNSIDTSEDTSDPPPPVPTGADLVLYQQGYKVWDYTYASIVHNFNFLWDKGDLEGTKKDEALKDLKQAKDKLGSTLGKWQEWRDAIKAKTNQGNRRDNLYLAVKATADETRRYFQENAEFGDGKL
jgi:hypothetical protein